MKQKEKLGKEVEDDGVQTEERERGNVGWRGKKLLS